MNKIKNIGNGFAYEYVNYRMEEYTDIMRQGIIYEGSIRSDFKSVPYRRPVWDSMRIVRIS